MIRLVLLSLPPPFSWLPGAYREILRMVMSSRETAKPSELDLEEFYSNPDFSKQIGWLACSMNLSSSAFLHQPFTTNWLLSCLLSGNASLRKSGSLP